MNKLEIACFNLNSAVLAQENGADRIELCAGIEVGGTTPTLIDISKARAAIRSDLFVMIRPRGGNFVYSDDEFDQMKWSILNCKSLQVNGFVFGILNHKNEIDVKRNEELVALAKPLPCTFHRAFDEVSNYEQALEDVISCGFQTILTSGQAENVLLGSNQLAKLVEKASNRIIIMPGGGLRSANMAFIQEKTRAVFYHSSAITDGSSTASADEIANLKNKLI